MNFECILYDKEQGVARINLNRPGVLNAMNKQLWIDFKAALEDAAIDPQVKAIVSSGYSDDPILVDHKQYGFTG